MLLIAAFPHYCRTLQRSNKCNLPLFLRTRTRASSKSSGRTTLFKPSSLFLRKDFIIRDERNILFKSPWMASWSLVHSSRHPITSLRRHELECERFRFQDHPRLRQCCEQWLLPVPSLLTTNISAADIIAHCYQVGYHGFLSSAYRVDLMTKQHRMETLEQYICATAAAIKRFQSSIFIPVT